ncbi:DNA repair protein RAD51 homolog 2 [Linum grandiflorum]
MANNLISNMGLPNSIANVFAARNLTTAKDALSLPEFDLMELLDVGLAEVISAVESISEAVSPPHQTQIQVSVLQGKVKLLVIDSMTALVSGESDQRGPRNHALGSHISFLKSLAEFSRIPVVVTNQVRSQSRDGVCQHNFQVHSKALSLDGAELADSHLVAALGVHWAHAVTIRLILEASLGQRFLKVSKSPISPSLAFPFSVESSGILLLDDTGREVSGHEINTIHCQGHNDIILFDGGEMQ